MDLTAAELAEQLGLEVRGKDPESVRIRGVNTLEKAGSEELSFLANPKYAPLLAKTGAGAVIVSAQDADKVGMALVSENPYLDFARAMQLCVLTQGEVRGVHELAFVDPEAIVEEGCDIFPFAFVGPRTRVGAGSRIFPGCYVGEDCELGQDCTLYPNVTLMAGVRFGDRVTVHAGTVLGSDGFGYAPSATGLQKIPQVGGVVVGDDVEIGANTAVDRAALDQTRIGAGTKIDNLVQVAHNVEIGEHSVLVAQVGISGSTKVGRGVTLAGQCGVAGHLKIGDGATIGPMSGVARDIPAGATMGGLPAMDKGAYLRVLNLTPKLPDMFRRLRTLEKEVEALRRGGQGEKEND